MILAPPPQAAPTLPALNARLVAFCRNRLNRRVGTGQCADLPYRALLQFGAMPRAKDAPNPGDYVWGRRIATITPTTLKDAAKLLPGDVLQYRDVVFERRTPTFWSRSTASHHTSVVARVTPETITVYEQNVNGRMTVGTSDLTLADLKRGTLWAYRPRRAAPRG